MPAPDRATQPVLTLLLTSVASFMVILDALVVVTALPSIHRDLGGGIGTLQWTVGAYTIAFGAGILTAAALGDRLGRRRVFVAGLALFTAASAVCALAPNSTTLITFRAFQGMGAAIIMPLALTLRPPLRHYGRTERRTPVLLGKAAGTLNTLQQFGAVFGIAIVTAVFNTHGSLAGPAAVTSGYRPALAVAAGLSVLGAVVAVGIRRAARTQAAGGGPRPGETAALEAIQHR